MLASRETDGDPENGPSNKRRLPNYLATTSRSGGCRGRHLDCWDHFKSTKVLVSEDTFLLRESKSKLGYFFFILGLKKTIFFSLFYMPAMMLHHFSKRSDKRQVTIQQFLDKVN